MYLKRQRTVNPKFSLRQLPIKANSKNKTEDLVCRRSVLLSRLAPLVLYVIEHSGNVTLIRGKFKNSSFQTKSLVAIDIRLQQLTVVRKSPILHIVRLTVRHHLFLEFWLVDTWFFTHWRHYRAATRLENVRQSNTRRSKRLGFQLSHKHPP